MKSKPDISVGISVALFLAFSAFVSCTKTVQGLAGQNAMERKLSQIPFSMGDSATIYNSIWLMGNQVVSPVADSAEQIGLTAAFTDSITGRVVGIKGLSVNSRVLSPNPDSTFYFDYGDSAAFLQEGLNFYGSQVAIKITGSTLADTVTQSIYMPRKVYGTSFPVGRINIAKDLALNWTTDAGNSWGKVVIKIFYNGEENRGMVDSTLPAADTTLTYTVPDNGSYTIDSTDLQRLKKNSYVTLSLGRGSEVFAILPVSGRRVFYFASASESSGPITLIYAP